MKAGAGRRRARALAALLAPVLALGAAERSMARPPSPPVPLPPARPAPDPEEPRGGAQAGPQPDQPPPPLPEIPAPASALPSTPPLPPARPPDRPAQASTAPASTAPASPSPGGGEVEACRERLRALGVRFEGLPPIREGACGTPFPVRVRGLAGNLDLAPAATVTCPVAEAFARWVQESLVPEAGRLLGRAPRRLRIGGAYECRGRNRVAGARLSEHAFGNALDLMGVEFDRGPAYTVRFQKAGSPEERFQAAIRAQACARFTTVLGPGSDAAHHDHLHLDLRARRGGAFCQ